MKEQGVSIDSILKSTAGRLVSFMVIALATVFAAQFFVLSYQQHRSVCEIVASQLNQFLGPLSRELVLDNGEIADSIFDDFKSKIASLGASPNLRLLPEDQFLAETSKVCMPSMFGATVNQPITFVGRTLGGISGRVTNYPALPVTLFVIGVLGAVILSVRGWAIRLIGKIQELVIVPIKGLSMGKDLKNEESLPVEVREVSKNIEQLKTRLVEEQQRVARLTQEKRISEMAVQVAHDIRSPLSILALMDQADFQLTAESRTLMAAAARRIQDIAQSLTKKYAVKETDTESAAASLSLVSVVVDSIVAEKRTVAAPKGISITLDVSSTVATGFAAVSSIELGRAVSNLLDNAIEAIEESGKAAGNIQVAARLLEDRIGVVISDDGPGISPEILPTLAQRGRSLKNGGTGLGLFHARGVCESGGGELQIESTLGNGTSVTMNLLKTAAPVWFSSSWPVFEYKKITLVDDDETIHQFFRSRLKGHELFHFYSPDDERLVDQVSDSDCFFLVDYQFMSKAMSGLDFIEARGISERAMLVTSRFDDPKIQQRAIELGVKIVPKQLLGRQPELICHVPPAAQAPHLALIDDDDLVQIMWRQRAEDKNLRLAVFASVDSFLKARLPLNTPTFVDQYLGGEKRGTKEAMRLYNHGYANLHLATSDTTVSDVPHFFKSVRWNKNFPEMENRRDESAANPA